MSEDLEQPIETPEVQPVVYCFFNGDRACGADCIAYMSSPAENDRLDPQQRNCLILVSSERLARHSTIGVKILGDMLTFLRQSDADNKRTAQKPPPPPR